MSLAQPAPAAPSEAQVKEATTHFKKGSDLFGIKKYSQALEEFRKSYAAVQSPNSHLYVARSLAALGKHREAYLEFDLVIAEADARAKTEEKYAPTRDTAKLERDELNSKLAFVTVNVTGPAEGARLTVAGVDVPQDRWGKPIPVTPGSVDVMLDMANKTPVTRMLTLKAGAKEDVTLETKVAIASSGGGGTDGAGGTDGGGGTDGSGGAPTKSSPLRPVAFVAAGLGVAGFALFGVMGSMSNSTYGDLKTLCGGEQACPTDKVGQASDLVDKGHMQQTLANVGLIVGAVGVAAAVPLFIISFKKPKPAPTTGLFIGPGQAIYRGTF